MTKGIIVRPVPIAPAQISAAAAPAGINAAFPATNLADPQPKTVVQSNVTAAAFHDISFTVDLGADTPFDVLALLFTNSSGAGIWAVRANPAADGGFVFATSVQLFEVPFGVTPTTRGARRHGLWLAPAPVVYRYLRFYLQETSANAEQLIRIGLVVVGQTVALADNFELGSGRRIEDQSITRTLPGGETAVERGGRTPLWRATWSNVSDAEMRAIWSLLSEIGTGAPLIICEDPDATPGLNERIHYGLLTGLDFTERVQQDKQRIDLTIREMT
jgi:hypothetical protein